MLIEIHLSEDVVVVNLYSSHDHYLFVSCYSQYQARDIRFL